MKTLSLYQTQGKVVFDLDKVYENLWAPLTDLQQEKIGFVPLFTHEDGEQPVYFSFKVDGYIIFNVKQTKRKAVKPDSIEREFKSRLKKLSRQEVSFDMDKILEEVNQDLIRMSEWTSKEYLTVFDVANKRFMIDAEKGKAEDCLQLVKNIIQEVEDKLPSFEVVMTDAGIYQPLLTQYVFKPDTLPEPIVLADMIKLGKKTIVGKSASAANITIKHEDISSKEVLNHLNNYKVVHALELDHDGVVYFNIDHTFKISGIKYEGHLKYEEDLSLSAGENFVNEYTTKLTELSKIVNILTNELNKEEK